MSDDIEVEIVRSAYAEKVKEAFVVFADNLSAGQPERACRERFLRAIDLARKARDLAVTALNEGATEEGGEVAEKNLPAAETLSAEDQALVDSVLAGTTGAPRVAPPPTRFGKP